MPAHHFGQKLWRNLQSQSGNRDTQRTRFGVLTPHAQAGLPTAGLLDNAD
jgi:hypothetical protein